LSTEPSACGSGPRACKLMTACVKVFGRRDDEPSTRSGGRRLESAKARNRGKWGTVRAAGSMGIWPRRQVGGGCSERPPQLLRRAGWVWVTGRRRAAGGAGQGWRCHCGPIYRPAVSGGYAGRASQNGERHWAVGLVVAWWRHHEVSIPIASVADAGGVWAGSRARRSR
jgi:hypothetical protein